MILRKPRALEAGDRIAIVSPASPLARDEFERGVAELRRLGFDPVYDDSAFTRASGYLAGPAGLRAETFLRYWRDPSIAALVAARGGFGSVHLLPLIADALTEAPPKLFVGFSDNTSLLTWLTCRCRVPALHGPMLEGRLACGSDGYDESSLLALLRNGAGLCLVPDGVLALRHGEASGRLFGGTMTQLTASLGTPYAFDPPEGCLLFLEDVNERPYRLDRMLTQLRLAGILSRARALVFGEMRGCDEPGGTPAAREVVEALTADFDGPVLFGVPSGHTAGPTWTLPLGVRVSVATRPRPALVVEESPVE